MSKDLGASHARASSCSGHFLQGTVGRDPAVHSFSLQADVGMRSTEAGYGEADRRLRRRWGPWSLAGCRLPRCQKPIVPLSCGTWDMWTTIDRAIPGRSTGADRATLGRSGHTPGAARRLADLEEKVVFGIVRCGRCGWLIRKGSGWRVGGNGPEHELCEHEPCAGGPPGSDLVAELGRDVRRRLASVILAFDDGEHRARRVVVLAATAVAVSCGGGGSGANRLTLTDDSCSYEGDQTPSAIETFEAEVVNESSKLGAFEIAKIDPGHTFDEVKAYVKSQQQRIADGLAFVPPPIWMTLGERAQIESGETGKLVSTVTTGTWVLWCAQEHPPTKLFLIEPALDISA